MNNQQSKPQKTTSECKYPIPFPSIRLDVTIAMAVDFKRHTHAIRHCLETEQTRKRIDRLLCGPKETRLEYIDFLLSAGMRYSLQEEFYRALSCMMEVEFLIEESDSDIRFRGMMFCLSTIYYHQKQTVAGLTYALVAAKPVQHKNYSVAEKDRMDSIVPGCEEIISKACRYFLNLEADRDFAILQVLRTKYMEHRPLLNRTGVNKNAIPQVDLSNSDMQRPQINLIMPITNNKISEYSKLKILQPNAIVTTHNLHSYVEASAELDLESKESILLVPHFVPTANLQQVLQEHPEADIAIDLKKYKRNGIAANIAFLDQILEYKVPFCIIANAKVFLLIQNGKFLCSEITIKKVIRYMGLGAESRSRFADLDVYFGFEEEVYSYCATRRHEINVDGGNPPELSVSFLKYAGNLLFKKHKVESAKLFYYTAMIYAWYHCGPQSNKMVLMAKLCNNMAVTYHLQQNYVKSKEWSLKALEFMPCYKKCSDRLEYISHNI